MTIQRPVVTQAPPTDWYAVQQALPSSMPAPFIVPGAPPQTQAPTPSGFVDLTEDEGRQGAGGGQAPSGLPPAQVRLLSGKANVTSSFLIHRIVHLEELML
jgi:hypothetical protein